MDWNVLGIEATKNKEAITAAYREKLKEINPEDKPEEFMALRECYEEALRLANEEEKPVEEDNSPLGLWKKELRGIYEDLGKRTDLECWKKLLSEDICMAIDTRADCEKAMLEFFMSFYYIPQEIWLYLDSEFSFLDRVEELYEKYPKDFIDYVIVNGVKMGERLPYKLFYPGKNGTDADEYIKLFNKACRTPWEEMQAVFDDIAKLSENHPYGDSLKLRFLMETEKSDRFEEMDALCSRYPESGYLLMDIAEEYYGREEWAKCEEYCRKALKLDDDKAHGKRLLSYSLAKQEKYTDAIKIIHDMMNDAEGDRRQLYDLADLRKEWNMSLIEKYEKELSENENDSKLILDLAWCYLQNDRFDDALKLADRIKEEDHDIFDYNNFMSQIYLMEKKYEDAVVCLDKLVAYLKELRPDGTEETDRRIARLQEMMARRAAALYEAGRENEGLAAYEEAEAFDPTDGETLTELAQIYMRRRDYEKALEYSKRIVKYNPGSAHGFMLSTICNFELGRDRDALDAVDRALDNYGGDLSAYAYKLRIYIRNGVYDGAHSLIDYLHENGAGEYATLQACEALLFEREGGDEKEALDKYMAVAKKIEDGEYVGFETEIYYRIASLTAAIADKEKRIAREEILGYLEKGLKYDPEDLDT